MSFRLHLLRVAVLAAGWSATAHGQDNGSREGRDDDLSTDAPRDPSVLEDRILVEGVQDRGAVIADIEPDITLDTQDIRAYGASSIDELLEELGPQVRSGSGRGSSSRVVFLLNGRRTSGFREIRSYPTEAVERVEILPEEVALKYGYRADQRVVNFVLRERFRALTVSGEGGAATEGGTYEGEASANLVRLWGDRRWNIGAEYEGQSALLESERDIRSSPQDPDLVGNVTALGDGGEIDPALSALAGEPVTIAGAPDEAADGPAALEDFAANDPNETDTTPFRSLIPRSHEAGLSAAYADVVFGSISATVSASLDYDRSTAFLGLADATLVLPADSPFSPFADDVQVARLFSTPDTLERTSETWDGAFNVVLNGAPGPWSWTLNGSYNRQETETLTDRGVDIASFQDQVTGGTANPFGRLSRGDFTPRQDLAERITDTGQIEALTNGDLFPLPGGTVSLSVKGGGDFTRLKSLSDTEDGVTETRLGRDEGNLQVNLDVPLMEPGLTWAPLGSISMGANGRVDHLSDFGTLFTYGYSVVWRPSDKLRLSGSVTREEGAPGISQLGDPVIRTPNVRVFDFATGETVDGVTQVTGGNPALANDDRRLIRLNFSASPFEEASFFFYGSYTDQKTEDTISSFPSLTPDAEAAFPDRFLRDDEGTLLEIDARSVNYAETRKRELYYGLYWSKQFALDPIELTPEERERLREIRRQRREERAGGRSRSQSRGQGRGGGRGQSARFFLSLNHAYLFEDTIQVGTGTVPLDLLEGDSLSSGGGSSRHQVFGRIGLSRRALNIRAVGTWQSGTFIADGAENGDLFFGDLTTVGLRLSYDPARNPRVLLNYPFLVGSRISLRVDNLFNARQEVTDSAGITPLGFQPNLIDPEGRTISISVRKLIF